MARHGYLLAIVLVAALFRLPQIERGSFWQDEVVTVQSATVPFLEVVSVVRQSENAPPLYFLIMNRWVAIFGSSDIALRLPSALAGVAAVIVISRVAQRIFVDTGLTAGLWAAAMLAVQPYHIAYSMEARPYALAFLLALWSCETMAVLIRRPSRTAQILYTLTSAAMVWTHTFCGLVWVAQNLVVIPLLWGQKTPAITLRRWLVLQGAVLVLLAPWVHASIEVYRMGAPWIAAITLRETLLTFSGSVVLLALWIALSIIAMGVGLKRHTFGVVLAAMLCTLPIVVPLVISALDRPMFVPRYAIASLIGIHLLCGYAAAQAALLRPSLGLLTGGAVALAGLWTSLPMLVRGATLLHHDDVRSAARMIDELARPGDAVCSSSVHYWPAFDRYCARRDLQRIQAPSQLADLSSQPGTVWLILEGNWPDGAIEGYSIASTWPMRGLKLVRADRTVRPKVE